MVGPINHVRPERVTGVSNGVLPLARGFIGHLRRPTPPRACDSVCHQNPSTKSKCLGLRDDLYGREILRRFDPVAHPIVAEDANVTMSRTSGLLGQPGAGRLLRSP